MSQTIAWGAGDMGRVLGVILKADGAPVDLTAVDAIECRQEDIATGIETAIVGLVGDANGAVSTEFVGPLIAGRYAIEWETTADGGSTVITYPGARTQRPILVIA